MPLEVFDEKNQTINFKKAQKNRKITQNVLFIILIIILLTLLICFRISRVEFDSIEAWEIDEINLSKEKVQILDNTKLNVFNNKITPNSEGTYRFSVKNKSDYDMIYNIDFSDEFKGNINMKYKLKMNNIYVKGNSDTYVNIDELNLKNGIVPKKSANVYTLEWKWEDDEKEEVKFSKMNEDKYYFKMQITSNIYEK